MTTKRPGSGPGKRSAAGRGRSDRSRAEGATGDGRRSEREGGRAGRQAPPTPKRRATPGVGAKAAAARSAASRPVKKVGRAASPPSHASGPAPTPARPMRPGIPPSRLTQAQRQHLRALGHHLKPLLSVGKEGVTDSFVKGVQEALIDHELVKVRLLRSCPADRDEVASDLPARAGAIVVQAIGKTLLLYAPHPTSPRIELPKASPRRQALEGTDAG